MSGRLIGFAIHKTVQQPKFRVYPCNFFSSLPAPSNPTDSNLVDDIRPRSVSEPETAADDRVNVVKVKKPSTTPPYGQRRENDGDRSSSSTPPYERRENGGDIGSFVADTAKQGVKKALETGLDIGEMAKKTLDNVWDVTKETTHMVKEAVAGDPEKNNDVSPTDKFVDDLRKRADGYDLKNKKRFN